MWQPPLMGLRVAPSPGRGAGEPAEQRPLTEVSYRRDSGGHAARPRAAPGRRCRDLGENTVACVAFSSGSKWNS
ncbi:hypothetical protein AV530_000463 [Patagioenas fasciata monilis]|uniref:Uncharacterized protein n=1 Tax=Patagioenas fasciata monilis TaxID=372326 RepID=A0A1V4JZD2_PATFA|nr:hypothetical protein AV530_000463 [Patagioenas fasciata monilis]